jgi:Immunoglobulin I-set domain/Beta-propeller repeat
MTVSTRGPAVATWRALLSLTLLAMVCACGGGGGAGGASEPAVAPTVVNQPANATVFQGQATTFTVLVTGTAPLAYQWRRNGVDIPGATGASFTIQAATSLDNGAQYSVVITNSAGTVTSLAATLTASPAVPPSITAQPVAVSVSTGNSATFSVVAGGTAPLSLQWLRNGVPIAGANSASYTLAAASAADHNVSFSVEIGNAGGSVVSNAALLSVTTGLVAPSISAQPASVSVSVGQTATFSVTAGGTAPLSYQWQRNGADIAGATATSYTTAATALADNAAIYRVRVSNSAGSATSSDATLTVTGPTGTGWVGARQGDTNEGETAFAVATDIDGGVVAVGTGPVVGSSGDAPDARVLKFDAAGVLMWSRRIQSAGANRDDNGYALAIDRAGNIYVGGSTFGSLAGQASAGGEDAFVARLDRNGQMVWIRQFGTNFGDVVRGLAIDPDGNVVAVGTSVVAPSGNHFAAKYAPDGTRAWLRAFDDNTVFASYANAVAVDDAGLIYLAGSGSGTNGLLIAKLDRDGARLWRAVLPDWRGAAQARGIAVSRDGNRLYVAGQTYGNVEGGVPTGTNQEGFLLQLSGSGGVNWARQVSPNAFPVGATHLLTLMGVATNADGSQVTVTGYAAGARSGTGATADDIIAARYDASGLRRWTTQIASQPNNLVPFAGDDRGFGVCMDTAGDAFVVGSVMGHLASSPAGTFTGEDWFVLKLRGGDGTRY